MSENILMVKISPEITLKTHFVRKDFIKALVKNIRVNAKNKGIGIQRIEKKGSRLLIHSDELNDLKEILKKTFGVHSFAFAYSFNFTGLEEVSKKAVELTKNFFQSGDSFKVSASRSGNHKFSSKDIEVLVGERILKSFDNLKVNLSNPKKIVFIEVMNESAFIFFELHKAPIGLPLGVEGNVLHLMQGSENDLLAAYLIMKRGCNLYPVAEKKSKEIEENLIKLKEWNKFHEFALTELTDLNDVKHLIKERRIEAIVFSDKELSDLKKSRELEEKFNLMPLRPLLLLPDEFIKKVQEAVS